MAISPASPVESLEQASRDQIYAHRKSLLGTTGLSFVLSMSEGATIQWAGVTIDEQYVWLFLLIAHGYFFMMWWTWYGATLPLQPVNREPESVTRQLGRVVWILLSWPYKRIVAGVKLGGWCEGSIPRNVSTSRYTPSVSRRKSSNTTTLTCSGGKWARYRSICSANRASSE